MLPFYASNAPDFYLIQKIFPGYETSHSIEDKIPSGHCSRNSLPKGPPQWTVPH